MAVASSIPQTTNYDNVTIDADSSGNLRVKSGGITDTQLSSDLSAVGEGHIWISPLNYSSIPQGTWSLGLDASIYLYGFFCNDATIAQNDELDFKVYLAKGTYTFTWVGLKYTNCGIISVQIDGVTKGTIDTYAGSPTYNAVSSITGISITSNGLKTLGLKMATKNASSSAYRLAIACCVLYRTA